MFCQKSQLRANLLKSRREEDIKDDEGHLNMKPETFKIGYLGQVLQTPFNNKLNNERVGINSYDIDDKRPYLKTKTGPMTAYNNKESPFSVCNSEVGYIRDIVAQDSFTAIPNVRQ